jgi:hypothetical protein
MRRGEQSDRTAYNDRDLDHEYVVRHVGEDEDWQKEYTEWPDVLDDLAAIAEHVPVVVSCLRYDSPNVLLMWSQRWGGQTVKRNQRNTLHDFLLGAIHSGTPWRVALDLIDLHGRTRETWAGLAGRMERAAIEDAEKAGRVYPPEPIRVRTYCIDALAVIHPDNRPAYGDEL